MFTWAFLSGGALAEDVSLAGRLRTVQQEVTTWADGLGNIKTAMDAVGAAEDLAEGVAAVNYLEESIATTRPGFEWTPQNFAKQSGKASRALCWVVDKLNFKCNYAVMDNFTRATLQEKIVGQKKQDVWSAARWNEMGQVLTAELAPLQKLNEQQFKPVAETADAQPVGPGALPVLLPPPAGEGGGASAAAESDGSVDAATPVPVNGSKPEIAAVPVPKRAVDFQSIGRWDMFVTADGRLQATVDATVDSSMDRGEFSKLSVVCGRNGQLKLSFYTYDGASHPNVVYEPDYNGGIRYAMTNNEIVGTTATDFLGQMMWAERQIIQRGSRLVGNFVSTDSDTGYASTFDMTGIEQVLSYIAPKCGS